MLARALAILLLLLASGLAGCMQGQLFSADWARERSVRPIPLEHASSREFDNAVSLAADGKYAEAEAAFLMLARQFKTLRDKPRAAEALFWAGYCQEKQGRTDQARGTYRRVVDSYGRTQAADMARSRLARIGPPETR